jgi:hypothetical protein
VKTGDARRKFEARLSSLGRAHNILSEEKWESAELHEIVHSVLEPYATREAGRLSVSGPPVRLAPSPALMLSMVLHELATNAAKYGALANGSGRIVIEWELLPGQRLRLTWKEAGGPAAQPGERCRPMPNGVCGAPFCFADQLLAFDRSGDQSLSTTAGKLERSRKSAGFVLASQAARLHLAQRISPSRASALGRGCSGPLKLVDS